VRADSICRRICHCRMTSALRNRFVLVQADREPLFDARLRPAPGSHSTRAGPINA
jgi:hypothetical protein